VTGLSPEQAPSQPLDKDPIAAAEIPRPFPALAHFMGPARERPDVVAARKQFEAADEQWQVALAGNFPRLEATGNWYLARSGSLDNGRWDAVLTLTLPLFEGGAAFSRVREASAASREAELNATTVARDASQEVRSLYEQARAGVERTGDLEAAARLAEEAYQRVNREFRLGLATNLEVLQTLNSFQETRRALFRTRCETLTDWARLQAASGRIPPLVPRL
ncbi:MAG: TolC family protein, partial [Bdellovibrionales bacterium]|nr:TolC family protein [Bdellovibrionales bacterium]